MFFFWFFFLLKEKDEATKTKFEIHPPTLNSYIVLNVILSEQKKELNMGKWDETHKQK